MLEGKNVVLRPIEEEDLILFKDLRNYEPIRRGLREYKPLNMLNQKKWFESLSDSNHIMFAIEDSEKLIGCCGLTYIDWKNGKSEISIYLGYKNWQESKKAEEVIDILLKYGFNELRLNRIYSIIFEFNDLFMNLCKRCNFKYEGEMRKSLFYDGKYWDEHIYGILADEYRGKR